MGRELTGFRVRQESLADDALVVVRGGLMDADTLRSDAVAALRRFGEYAVSVLAAPDAAALDTIARATLVRHARLTVMTAGAIRATGLELRPTFRRPHYSVMLPDLPADLARLLSCQTEERTNPHHRPPKAQP